MSAQSPVQATPAATRTACPGEQGEDKWLTLHNAANKNNLKNVTVRFLWDG